MHFLNLEKEYRQAYFHDLSDVTMCEWNGRDKSGLSHLLRLRSSNRCENYHQKLQSSIGSWIVWPLISHYVLLILTYRCNASTNACRCDGFDFRHYNLYLIDRMQMRVQQLHKILIFKTNINLSIIKTYHNFVSVGIEKLHCSSDDVSSGPPDDTS